MVTSIDIFCDSYAVAKLWFIRTAYYVGRDSRPGTTERMGAPEVPIALRVDASSQCANARGVIL